MGTATQDGPRAETASGYRTLFVVPFRTAMTDADLNRVADQLNMATHLHPKLYDSPSGPGVARLDFDSGLFLLSGAADDEWRLEARTWGAPAEEFVHGWQLLAADAARLLDPSVPVLGRPEAETAAPELAPRHRWDRPRRGGRRS